MDEVTKTTTAQTESSIRPSINKVDATPQFLYSCNAAYNDFLIRLEQLRGKRHGWNDLKNQGRPFKNSFVEFIRNLVLRLPVAPEITPQQDGTVKFLYKKRAPRDKWQSMEIIIYPQRHFEMTAKSRMSSQKPFKRTNMARPDYISDMIVAFFEHDTVNTKEHPLRYRKATTNDYPFISAMCQMTFGPHTKYHVQKISELLKYCIVCEDPIYGIVSVAAIAPMRIEDVNPKEPGDNADFEVQLMITAQNYRGLSLVSKCLRKAVTNLLIDHPDATVLARSVMSDGATKDVCQSALRRAGFKRYKIVRGEKKYCRFDCDRCNILNGNCVFDNPDSVCSVVYYKLGDYGGKMGYGGKKPVT